METFSHAFPCMGTVVTLQTLQPATPTHGQVAQRDHAFSNARAWFRRVEQCCNRFDETSELRHLCDQPGAPVAVSDVLFEAIQFAVAVAEATDGAFDPTVGRVMHVRGFDRDYRTGLPVVLRDASGDTERISARASFADIELDAAARTVTLHAPLLLDLGAVAKGLAVDMAVRELSEFPDVVVDAGGDLFVRGCNSDGNHWRIGIRHPRDETSCIETVSVAEGAICTSGDYERRGKDDASHILHAPSGRDAEALASVTVIAPSAMVADALGTAAFALGPEAGLQFLQRHHVDALLIAPSLQRWQTAGWAARVVVREHAADGARIDSHSNLVSR